MTPFDLDATWRDAALCIGLHARFDPPTSTAPCAEPAKFHGDSGVRGGVLMLDGHASRWPQEGPA